MALHRLPATIPKHAARWLFTIAGLLLGSCLGFDDGDLTEPPDGSHCPDEAPGWCDETCVDTASDVSHCGGCGAACEAPPQVEGLVCDAGACAIGACAEGFDDCDGEHQNGCEAELATSKEHCGTCGQACSTECLNGACNDPIEVSAGASYTCAIRASGSVWCWGDNAWGNLGIGAADSRSEPTKVELPGRATAISTGQFTSRKHTCALLEDGQAYCWGANGDGQLGTGDEMNSGSPLPVRLPPTEHIVAGGLHTCSVSSASQLHCWGSNGSGQLGKGAEPSQGAPVQVLLDIELVAVGVRHTCARQTTKSTVCWGDNASGQIGNNSTTTITTPLLVPALSHPVAFGLGARHSCALFGEGSASGQGSMKCWGEGEDGQLGLGTTADALAPQLVIERGVTSLAIGAASSSAIVDGEAWAWGLNADGQLGLGHAVPTLTPTRTSLGPVKRFSLGDRHGCAIRPPGELVCWGANDEGQLGLTRRVKRSLEPRPVVFPPEGPASRSAPDARDAAPEGDQ